jgi:2-polyprenyl-6-methoxyphenol hydroxylase-like FAD-dependent oxidoreductase
MSRLLLKRVSPGSLKQQTQHHQRGTAWLIWPSHRYLSTSSSLSQTGEKLRVAVVGGGCAGLSSALHLAPLVDSGLISSPIDVYDTPSSKDCREIGVGIWSTALDPFLASDRASHQFVYDEMVNKHGSWLGEVGYRTPSGAWLTKSHLPTSIEESRETGMPALLFLREKDMLQSLQKAVHWEEQRGTIKVYRDGRKTSVTGLYENSSQPWSTNLLLHPHDEKTERDYHLIIAADGTNSVLRKRYGGHDLTSRILMGTAALPSPVDLTSAAPRERTSWDESRQQDATIVQDRGYTVFRGNANLTQAEMGGTDENSSISFQTWGEGKSMRFATVPMNYPGPLGKREERQVWFITTDDEEITAEADPLKRRAILLDMFKDWHEEICQIVEATPPDQILMERAVAHRHVMGPVLNLNKVIKQLRGSRPPNSGEGPCVMFMGDAYMTVDPILAQGFTLAMEGAHALRKTVEDSCVPFEKDPKFAFDPYKLRNEFQERHDARTDRLVCLLRATELVQALGQPTGAAGAFNTKVLRPIVKLLPNIIKAPIFDAVLKYSLGLSQWRPSPAPVPAAVDVVDKKDDNTGSNR